MFEERSRLVGRDDDDSIIWAIMIACMVIVTILAIMVYGGIFIGGFHSLKNYIISFKHNIVDSNMSPAMAD